MASTVLTVLRIEAIKAMESISMRMHIQCIDRQVVSCQVQRLEDLAKSEITTVTESDDVLNIETISLGLKSQNDRYDPHVRTLLHLGLDET